MARNAFTWSCNADKEDCLITHVKGHREGVNSKNKSPAMKPQLLRGLEHAVEENHSVNINDLDCKIWDEYDGVREVNPEEAERILREHD